MTQWFPGLPDLGKAVMFVAAMLLLNMALAMAAGVMSAFGHPELLAAVREAAVLRDPLLEAAVALLPAAAAVDLVAARAPIGD